MITEDYISFETAKLLKEKGFEQLPSLVPEEWICSMYDEKGKVNWGCYSDDWYCRITLQMAMKWLREVHHCVICITPLTFYCGETVSKWGYCIWAGDNTEVDEESSPRLESYEEAAEAAIKFCLENLI